MQQIKVVKNKSSEFREESDTHKAEHGYNFEEENLEVVPEEIHDHSGSLIGGDWTHLARKNHTSDAIGTRYKGLKVMDESRQIYLDRLPDGLYRLIDLVYIHHLDWYLLYLDWKIYRKDIDEKAPYFFMDLNCGGRVGNTLRYSQLNKRLIVRNDMKSIAVVNLERKQVEIEMESGPGNPNIMDFIIFGRKENKIAWITQYGLVNLSSVSYDSRKITSKTCHQVDLIHERREYPTTLAVCDLGKHLVTGIGDRYQSSRLMTLEVKNNSLHLLHILDEYDQEFDRKECFSFIQRFGKHLVWVGAPRSIVSTYCFDCESGEMKELAGKRIVDRYYEIFKFHRIDEKCLYFVDFKGKLVRLTVRI